MKQKNNLLKRLCVSFLLSKDYYFFVMVVFILVVISLIFSFFSTQKHLINSEKYKSIIAGNQINQELAAVFNQSKMFFSFVGYDIVKNTGTQDFNKVNELIEIVKKANFFNHNVALERSFSWVTPDNIGRVSYQNGIDENKYNFSERKYTSMCPKLPFTLQFSYPAVSIRADKEWILPMGLGVVNEEGKYIGLIAGGYSISGLTTYIIDKLYDKKISFIVLDKDYNIVLKSPDNHLNKKSRYYKEFFSSTKSIKNKKGMFEYPVTHFNICYLYCRKLKDNYNFTVITGFNTAVFNENLCSLLFPRFIEIGGVGLIFLIILYFFRKKLFKIHKSTTKAQEVFSQQLKNEMNGPLEIILSYSEVLRKNLRGQLPIVISSGKQKEFLDFIYEAAISLCTFSFNTLNIVKIDVNNTIKDCIIISRQIAATKEIILEVALHSSTEPFYGDELKFKQVILGILALNIDYMPKKSTIKISSFINTEGLNSYMVVQIQDDGFGLNQEDIIRISQKFKTLRTKWPIHGVYLESKLQNY